MAVTTAIEWTDATVNFWWGCTKVGPGCEHCYAEAWDGRFGESHFGLGVARRKIKGAVSLIHRLDNAYSEWAADAIAARGNAKAFGGPAPSLGNRRRVFIQSMSDLFDLEVPLDWFAEAWEHIEACDRIDVQIVTKRISAVEKRLAAIGRTTWPRHVGLIITVCNQAEADRDVPRLLALKAKLGIPWVGLSVEPLLGAIELRRITVVPRVALWRRTGVHIDALSGRYVESGLPLLGEWDIDGPYPDGVPRVALDWVIVGGESGPRARPMHPDWARSLRDQCAAAGVAFFFKQWGEWGRAKPRPSGTPGKFAIASAGPGSDFWPQSVTHVDQYPRAFALFGGANILERVGRARAGRMLDGREHNDMPRAA